MTTPIFRKYAILLGLLSCAGASHGSESLLPESTSGDSIRLHELFVNGRRMYDHKLPIPQYLKTIDADRIDLMNPPATAFCRYRRVSRAGAARQYEVSRVRAYYWWSMV